MKQLEETVLGVRSRDAVMSNSCLIFQRISLAVNSLAVAFHLKLLNVRNELIQWLGIGDNDSGLVASDSDLIEMQGTEHHRNIFHWIRRCKEMRIDIISSLKEVSRNIEAKVQSEWKDANCAPDAESASDPVPEAEHVLAGNAEL